MIVTSILLGIAAFGGTFVAAFGVMMFDAPGSENAPGTIALFASVCAFPIVCGATLVGSWILYSQRMYKLACAITVALPLLNALAIVAAIIWVDTVQAGKFAP
ncbi:MAG: hypothetical protein JSS27_20510 [Planctomycetes bacterium]|nr:hypothetical protein [Planctomycetota bacterium]